MTFWILYLTVFLGIFLGAESFALITKERWFPTLSRTLWRKLKLEDRGFDRHERRVRWAGTIIATLIFIWGVIHIAWGPCAFELC